MNLPKNESINKQKTIGVFLDGYNIAFQSHGVLDQALDYLKLRDYIGTKYGTINISIAYFDGKPIPPEELRLFDKASYSDLVEEMKNAGWIIYEGGLYADEAIINDMQKTKHMFDYPVFLTSDYRILSSAKEIFEQFASLSGRELITELFLKDDPTVKLIKKALKQKEKDIAAILLGARLEKAVDNLAQIHGIKNKFDPLAKVTDTLYKSKIIKDQEYQKITKYRKIRNSSTHGEFNNYSLEDVLEFSDWLLAWEDRK